MTGFEILSQHGIEERKVVFKCFGQEYFLPFVFRSDEHLGATFCSVKRNSQGALLETFGRTPPSQHTFSEVFFALLVLYMNIYLEKIFPLTFLSL